MNFAATSAVSSRSSQGALPNRAASACAAPKGADSLTGLVEIVTFHNEENGFCVLKCRVKGESDLIPVIGHTPTVTPGEYVTARGDWVVDRDHGRQFKAEVLKTDPPSTENGIERFLGSGLVKGIGPVLAKRLVGKFGLTVFDAMEEAFSLDPVEKRLKNGGVRLVKHKDERKLLQVEGVGSILADRIQRSWSEQKYVREIMVFLHSHAVTTSKAVRIYKKYGKDAIAKVSDDPYCLARDIRGIGFLSADRIAQHMGVPLDSPARARAGISHVLGEATSDDGHCGLPHGKLVEKAVELLAIPQQTIVDAIAHEIEHGAQLQQSGDRNHPLGEGLIETTVAGQRGIFLPSLFRSEQVIAHHVKRLSGAPVPWPKFDVELAIPWVEEKLRITLAESQKQAVRVAVRSKVMVITGGPGVGKTTLLNSVLNILVAKRVRVLLCAPTGKAAKRMSETTGREAKTIHRLLEVDPASGGFKRNRSSPLDCDLLVVDESSMIDVPLAAKLLDAIATGTAVIFVGDVDQLPSVGPGQFLVDLIDSGVVNVARLTEVFRQAATSRIIRAAHAMNQGKVPELPAKGEQSDFHFFQVEEPDEIAALVVELVRNFVPKRFGFDPIRDIQVLCPMKSGVTGSRNLNAALQQALNPPGVGSVEKFGIRYGVGDKVMQIENDYDKDAFNGDVGIVAKIDHDETQVTVDFDGREVVYDFTELDELVLSYAFSIHKSQGSEFPAVVMPISTQHFTMLQRNLLYTGVTRGKSLVIGVGTTKAMNIAVRNRVTGRRFSKLGEWLREALPPVPVPATAPAKDDLFGLN